MKKFEPETYQKFLEKDEKAQMNAYMRMVTLIKDHNQEKQKIKVRDGLKNKNEELQEQLKTLMVQYENQTQNNDPSKKDNNNNNQNPIQQAPNMLGSEKKTTSPVQLPQLPKSESNSNMKNQINNNNNTSTNNNLEIQLNGTHMSFAGQKDQGKPPINRLQQNPSTPQINSIGASSAGTNEQIEQLKMTIVEKDRSLIQASAKIEENSQLKESIRILEERNSELRIRIQEMQQNSNLGGADQSQQVVQLKDQLNKLNFENARQVEMNTELEKNIKEQDKVMEYLVTENSRLIIKSSTYSQRNINNIL